jgi:CHAT domain-containing protein/Flp pilus assembly protein TadD
VRGQQSAKPLPPERRFTDDFSTDTRAQYEIRGPVRWEKGSLTIGEGAVVAKRIEPGQFVDLEVHLDLLTALDDDDDVKLEICFQLDSGQRMMVLLTQHPMEGENLLKGRLFSRSDTDGEDEELRGFGTLRNLGFGSLKLSYHAGVIRIGPVANPAALAYGGDDTSSVRAIQLTSQHHKFRCSMFSIARRAFDEQQVADINEVWRLLFKADRLRVAGQMADALPLCERAVRISGEVLGEEHPAYAISLISLSAVYNALGEDTKAVPLDLKALATFKWLLGPEHPDYIRLLESLAEAYERIGEYAKAEPYLLQVLEIRRKVSGEQNADFAASLNSVALLYRRMGQYAKAESHFLQSLAIRRNVSGEANADFADSLNNLAMLYRSMGAYAKAEPLYLQALEIRGKVLGEEHYAYGASLNNLGTLYKSMGEYAKAERFAIRGLRVTEDALGKDHLACSTCLHNLATLYKAMGDYAKAETLYHRALAILKKSLGDEHPDYANHLRDLARLHKSLGEYRKAEPLYRESLQISRRLLGEDHPDFASTVNDLASLYNGLGEFAKAEPLYVQAMEIRKRTLGEEHPDYAASLNNLAGFYLGTGDTARAEPMYLQALRIAKKTFGEEHPDYASFLSNVATMYFVQGNFAKAEEMSFHAVEVCRNAVGEQHLDYACCLANLATLTFSTGKFEEAEDLYRQALDIRLGLAYGVGRWLPEARLQDFLIQIDVRPDALLSSMRYRDAIDRREAYQAAWKTRGVATRLVTTRGALVCKAPEAKRGIQKLQRVSQQLAQVTLATTEPDLRESRRRRLKRLHTEKEALEAQIAKISVEYLRQTEIEEADVSDLATLLGEKMAVIDIIKPGQLDPPAVGKPLRLRKHYEAFVLRPGDEESGYTVAWVHLGPKEAIDKAVADWRSTLTGNGPSATAALHTAPAAEQASDAKCFTRMPERLLREAIWDKLEPHLAGCSKVVIIPDGDLHFIPWNALPGRKAGSYLIEDYAISVAPYGQQLYAALTDTHSAGEETLLVGGVAYDQPPAAVKSELSTADPTGCSRGPSLEERITWPRLPGTAAEIQSVAALGQGTERHLSVITGTGASETHLRTALPGCRRIHLATHGFFADERFRSWAGHDLQGEQLLSPGGSFVTASRSHVTQHNPMILSGIVLAGANLPPATDELGLPTGQDGILTAEEIVGLDLRGTDLVVLSACETGLGRVAGGEGVMGLTRAFHMAGAKTVMASLWKVDDAATQALMKEFYKNLWEKKLGKLESLRQAQLAMIYGYEPTTGKLRAGFVHQNIDEQAIEHARRRLASEKGNPLPPFYWAAFTLSGDWR